MRKRKHHYGRNQRDRLVDLAVNIAAVTAVILIAVLSYQHFVKKKPNIAIGDVAAMRVSYVTAEELYGLSSKAGYDFSEFWAVYMVEKNFFPVKKEPDSSAALTHFRKSYQSIKRKYNANLLAPYINLFSMLAGEINAFPVYDSLSGRNGYMYADSFGLTRKAEDHFGVDIIDRENTEGRLKIIAVATGEIIRAGVNSDYGYYVEIQTTSGTKYFYANLDSLQPGIEKGSSVAYGETLGSMGAAGKKEAESGYPVKLHFEIIINLEHFMENININPYIFLRLVENSLI